MGADLMGARLSLRSTAAVLGVTSLLWFALNVDFLMRGDATTYANYALLGKFDDITLHNGYYFVVYALQHWLAGPLGVPVHETMAWLNVLCGAMATVLVLLFTEALVGDRRLGVLAALLFVLSGRVLMNATSSEIYMLQTVCVLASMLAYVKNRFVLAGVAAGCSLLVSPLSAFAFLFFPVWEATRGEKIRWKAFALFVAAGTVVYLPYLVTCWRELFWGRRGLLVVREAAKLDLPLLAVNIFKYQFKHYTLLWVLLLPALFHVSRHKRLAWLTLAVAIPHGYIVAKLTTEDHTFLLNVDPFIVMWMAIGLGALLSLKAWRWVAPLPLVVHLLLYVKSGMLFSGEYNKGYAAEMRGIAEQYIKGKPAVLISDWDVGIAMAHFGSDSITSIPEEDPVYRQMYDFTDDEKVRPSLDGVTIYLLDPWSPSPINRILRSRAALEQLRATMSIRAQAEQKLGLVCTELARGTHVLYRCERRAAANAG
ncbi:MAG: hypothetical protein K2Y26_08525 [Gemmatimonadaceae bacterium]|nr:hypothetical protein [Gemmatimonadaceae bacterium]